ncbi:MAG: hypothetical protein K2P78_09650 [Gemmataceae bacterium]|nr:hypothetical protein [Gemmataceae bacterium]
MADLTPVPPTIDETARKRFEAAWVRGEPLPIDAVLPPADDVQFVATLEELVHIELEFGWKAARDGGAGKPPIRHAAAGRPRPRARKIRFTVSPGSGGPLG